MHISSVQNGRETPFTNRLSPKKFQTWKINSSLYFTDIKNISHTYDEKPDINRIENYLINLTTFHLFYGDTSSKR